MTMTDSTFQSGKIMEKKLHQKFLFFSTSIRGSLCNDCLKNDSEGIES